MTKKEIFKPYIDFYNKNKKKVLLIITGWFILMIILGVVIAVYTKRKLVLLTPEEENSKALKILKSEIELIESGKLLTTKNNMTITEIEYSSNYVNSRKDNSGKGE